ncbi:hypothetical protein IQ61_38110 [Streptomyces scabiei]|nr:hypothetical protein IQ61_38110 [Streptomyces scabiei]
MLTGGSQRAVCGILARADDGQVVGDTQTEPRGARQHAAAAVVVEPEGGVRAARRDEKGASRGRSG